MTGTDLTDTDTPVVIDAETEEVAPAADAPTTRPFRVVTHKPSLVAYLGGFGGVQDVGVSVDPDTADQTLWWMSQDWAIQVLNNNIALPQLLAPTPGWVAGLPERFLNRQVGTLRKCDIPRYYAKHPAAAEKNPQVALSAPGEHTELLPTQLVLATDLAAGVFPPGFDRLPDPTLLQLDELLPCVVEVRCWIADGEVVTSCPYRIGMVGWDSSLFLEMLFNAEGQKLTDGAVDMAKVIAREVDGPRGYAIDIGVTVEGTATVLRAWPAWSVEPLAAEPSGVFAALVAAHDFDHADLVWRWTPDRAVYDRSHLNPPASAETGDQPAPADDEEDDDA